MALTHAASMGDALDVKLELDEVKPPGTVRHGRPKR
jgi:hypothetical protein